MKASIYFSDDEKMNESIGYLKDISGMTDRTMGDVFHECVIQRYESFYKNFKGCDKQWR